MPSGVRSNCEVSIGYRWETCLLVDLVIRSRGTPSFETKVVVAVLAPAKGRVRLDREDGRTGRKDTELVLVVLGVEHFKAGNRHETGLDALLLELGNSLVTEADLGTSRDEGDVGVLDLFENVTTLGGLLDGRVGELGKLLLADITLHITHVLTRKSEDGGSVLGEDCDQVRGRSLVTVGRAPEGEIGGSTEPGRSLDRLVGGSVLTETDRVVCRDLKDAEVRQGAQTDSAGGVRDKVEESGAEGNETTVSGETVADGSHAVLANTESEVSALVATKTGRGVLEVFGTLPTGQVGTSQVGRTANELGKNFGELVDGGL